MRFRLSTSPGSDHSIWLSHPLCLEQRSFILASHKSISPCDNTVTSTTDAMYSMYHVYVYSYVNGLSIPLLPLKWDSVSALLIIDFIKYITYPFCYKVSITGGAFTNAKVQKIM